MFKNLFQNYIYPIATLSGTIIGVGVFSLPYITSKVGGWVMLGYFLILGSVVIIVHQFFGKVCLKTPNFKRLPGFAKIYLGKTGEFIAYFSTILGLFGSLLAYLIVGGEFLENLFSPIWGGSNLIYTLSYFTLGALLIYFGIKAIAQIEFWGLILFFATLIAIFLKAQPFLKIENLFPVPDANYLFLPYGAILFSLWGASLIPEVEEMLGSRKKFMKRIISISTIIPVFVYLFFILLILGITGSQTTESALSGLKNFLGNGIVSLGLFFGVLTTFTSFITLGLTLKKVFIFDLGIKKIHAFIITCFTPLILFLLGLKSFISVISFIGGVLLGIDGILILLMYKKINPKQSVLIFPLIFIFLVGIIYEIIYFIK